MCCRGKKSGKIRREKRAKIAEKSDQKCKQTKLRLCAHSPLCCSPGRTVRAFSLHLFASFSALCAPSVRLSRVLCAFRTLAHTSCTSCAFASRRQTVVTAHDCLPASLAKLTGQRQPSGACHLPLATCPLPPAAHRSVLIARHLCQPQVSPSSPDCGADYARHT